MAKGAKKVYMPDWYIKFMTLIMVPIWIFITYSAFYTAKGQAELGLFGWLMMTFVFAMIIGTFWYVVKKKMPVYLIAE